MHAVLLLWALTMCAACGPPDRPKNVPRDSTFVDGGKSGYWQRCKALPDDVVWCTVWNQGGAVLLDERFRPIDEGPVPSVEELRSLRAGGPCTGAYRVCLSNGRMLLPHSRFDELKAFHEGRWIGSEVAPSDQGNHGVP